MARVAISIVENVVTYPGMFWIRLRLGVTYGALKDLVICWTCMAGRAYSPCASMRSGEPGVVECGPCPSGRGMACFARCRISGSPVVWIRGIVVLGRMARITSAVGESVVAVRVTRLTTGCNVYAGEREFGRAMIKRRWLPRSGGVTRFTNLAETPGNMVWIRCTLEICGMTLVTVRIH